ATAARRIDHVKGCCGPGGPRRAESDAARRRRVRRVRARREVARRRRGAWRARGGAAWPPAQRDDGEDLALWHAATRIKADSAAAEMVRDTGTAELSRRHREGALPDVVVRELTDFLSRYGHRAVAEIDLGMPRWSDEPAYVLGALGNYPRRDDPELAPDVVFARAESTAEEAVRRLVAKARRR